jgi:hypothetical protein
MPVYFTLIQAINLIAVLIKEKILDYVLSYYKNKTPPKLFFCLKYLKTVNKILS